MVYQSSSTLRIRKPSNEMPRFAHSYSKTGRLISFTLSMTMKMGTARMLKAWQVLQKMQAARMTRSQRWTSQLLPRKPETRLMARQTVIRQTHHPRTLIGPKREQRKVRLKIKAKSRSSVTRAWKLRCATFQLARTLARGRLVH